MLLVTGISHKTAPVELRERVSFSGDDLPPALDAVRQRCGAEEAVILSTCNRTEVYARGEAVRLDSSIDFLANYHHLSPHDLREAVYALKNQEAVGHLFKVAAGMDSLVLGEPQILGQVKEAYGRAKAWGHTGPVLNHLFEKAFSAAKRVRAHTALGEGGLSLSSVAVELALKIFGELESKTVALVGAGEMAELAARHLVSRGVGRLWVLNRTAAKAEGIVRRLGGEAFPFEALPEALHAADIFVTSTASPTFIITKGAVQGAVRRRRRSPLFFIDIAVPRDVEPSVNELEGVFVYDMDDLQRMAEDHARGRQEEVERAGEIIGEEVEKFLRWQASLLAAPAIVSIRHKAERIRREELEKTLSKLNGLSQENQQAICRMSTALVNRLLHGPMVQLKEGAMAEGGVEGYIQQVCSLFGVESKSAPSSAASL